MGIKEVYIILTKSKFILLFTIMFSVISGAGAQNDRRIEKWFAEAREHFSMQSYDFAIEFCRRILENDSAYTDARLLLADIYKETNDRENEIIELSKAKNSIDNPLIYYRLGDASYSLEKYEQALEYFLNYSNSATLSEERSNEIQRRIESCKFAAEAVRNPVEFNPEKLSGNVNSAYDDYWPSLSIDQQQLIFTRLIKVPGRMPQEDFFYSDYSEKEWTPAVPLKRINTNDNEGAQSVSADGRLLFFTACNRRDGIGSCDIYYSVRRDGEWSTPLCAGTPLNSAGWESQPSLSSDGKYLYFSSDRPGGKGGKDLWRAECLGFDQMGILRWKSPENLGDSINTIGNETSPFIHAGNRNFYFSSDYHTGMGGYDLFVSQIIDDSVFSNPKNLGFPINTVNDEQGMYISGDGKTAYFSSSREENGNIDIYSFSLPEQVRPVPATYVNLRVSDIKTNQPVKANVELADLTNKDREPLIQSTDKSGRALISLPAGSGYAFSVAKEGYLFYSRAFDLSSTKDIYNPYDLDIKLTPVEVGAEMNLYNIYFETDSFSILPESEPELLKLVNFLDDNSMLKVEIQGHTDNTGTEEKNMILSENRAHSVVKFLVNHGINESRLEWQGYGESRPVADNEDSEGRRLNRRTTIKIIN